MDVADNAAVDFQFIRLEARQQRQPGKSRSEIIYRQANTRRTELTHRALEGIKAGNDFIFRHLDDHLFRHQAIFSDLLKQDVDGIRDRYQGHR